MDTFLRAQVLYRERRTHLVESNFRRFVVLELLRAALAGHEILEAACARVGDSPALSCLTP